MKKFVLLLAAYCLISAVPAATPVHEPSTIHKSPGVPAVVLANYQARLASWMETAFPGAPYSDAAVVWRKNNGGWVAEGNVYLTDGSGRGIYQIQTYKMNGGWTGGHYRIL